MTSPELTNNRDNYCYRHPDRMSFVLCQRCMRTICPECQTQAAVGVICPECMKAERKARTPAQRKAERRWGSGNRAAAMSLGRGRPIVTYVIMAITAFIGLLQLIPGFGASLTLELQFVPAYLYPQVTNLDVFMPWTPLTTMLVHGGLWHLGLNMLSLWMLGRTLEPMLGRWRFLVLYIVGGFGGSVAVAVIAPTTATVGASGALFALLGALLVIGRSLGGDVRGILVLLAINLVIGFIPGFNIAWEAHVGGLITGVLVGVILWRTRKPAQRVWQIVLLTLLGVLLVAVIAIVPPLILAPYAIG